MYFEPRFMINRVSVRIRRALAAAERQSHTTEHTRADRGSACIGFCSHLITGDTFCVG